MLLSALLGLEIHNFEFFRNIKSGRGAFEVGFEVKVTTYGA